MSIKEDYTQDQEAVELAHHPTVRQYVNVAIVLSIVTALEVAVYYMSLGEGVLVALLLVFAVLKFALVVLWFMHLKFDSRLFRRLFVVGLGFAVTVFGVVLWIFFARGGASPTLIE